MPDLDKYERFQKLPLGNPWPINRFRRNEAEPADPFGQTVEVIARSTMRPGPDGPILRQIRSLLDVVANSHSHFRSIYDYLRHDPTYPIDDYLDRLRVVDPAEIRRLVHEYRNPAVTDERRQEVVSELQTLMRDWPGHILVADDQAYLTIGHGPITLTDPRSHQSLTLENVRVVFVYKTLGPYTAPLVLSDNPSCAGHSHPHSKGIGDMCWGEGETQIRQLVSNGLPSVAHQLITKILHSYKIGALHWYIDRWHFQQCHLCEVKKDLVNYVWCDQCKKPACTAHYRGVADAVVCTACFESLPKCGTCKQAYAGQATDRNRCDICLRLGCPTCTEPDTYRCVDDRDMTHTLCRGCWSWWRNAISGVDDGDCMVCSGAFIRELDRRDSNYLTTAAAQVAAERQQRAQPVQGLGEQPALPVAA